MLRKVLLMGVVSVFVASAQADLKPDFVECDAKKATRNAALDASVGVSGGCDAEKLAKKTKEDAKDAVTPDMEKSKGKLKHDKDRGVRGKDKS